MEKSKFASLKILSVVIFVLGLMMFGYWIKYIIDGLPLKDIPILSEGIAAILALITGPGLYFRKKWSLPAGLVLCGFWLYGCLGGVNLVLYDLIVYNELKYISPIGALTDAVLFIVIIIFAIILAAFLWKRRGLLMNS